MSSDRMVSCCVSASTHPIWLHKLSLMWGLRPKMLLHQCVCCISVFYGAKGLPLMSECEAASIIPWNPAKGSSYGYRWTLCYMLWVRITDHTLPNPWSCQGKHFRACRASTYHLLLAQGPSLSNKLKRKSQMPVEWFVSNSPIIDLLLQTRYNYFLTATHRMQLKAKDQFPSLKSCLFIHTIFIATRWMQPRASGHARRPFSSKTFSLLIVKWWLILLHALLPQNEHFFVMPLQPRARRHARRPSLVWPHHVKILILRGCSCSS